MPLKQNQQKMSNNLFDDYKFRAHAIGKIVSKSGKLTQTAKTYLIEKYIEETEDVRKEVTSKYFEKGLLCEEEAITFLQDHLYKGQLLLKNKERKRNDFVSGECDTIAPDNILYDIKNAYDKITLGKASLTWEYEWQVKAYLWLWDKQHGRIFYCLMNMPEILLMDEEKKLFYQGGFLDYDNPAYQKACEDLRKFYDFSNMPPERRFKVWDITLSKEDIERMKEAVIQARTFLNEYHKELEGIYQHNLSLMGKYHKGEMGLIK